MAENTRITAATLRGFPDLLLVKDVQRALRIGRSTAYKLLESGQLQSFRIGASYRIPKSFLIEYLNQKV